MLLLAVRGPLYGAHCFCLSFDDLLVFYFARLIFVAVDHAALVAAAEKHFGKLAAGTPKAAVGFTPFTGSEVKVRDDLKKKAHFAIAVEAPGAGHADYYPMLVAAAHVGSFDSAWYGRNTTGSPLAQFSADHHVAKRYSCGIVVSL